MADIKLNLTKPLIIFDLETTGLNIATAEIVQIAYVKIYPNGKEERYNSFVKPKELPSPDGTGPVYIPAEVEELTGITDEMVENAPTFKEIGPKIKEAFEGCDLCGYDSNHFDVPLLAEEFLRNDIPFDFTKSRLIDAEVIFKKMEQRNLAAAYKFYCGRKMEDDFKPHHAENDAEATYRVLLGEIERYSAENQEEEDRILKNDMASLADFSKQNDNIDFAGRFIWEEKKDAMGQTIKDADGKPVKVEVFNFGKHKGKPVAEVLSKEPGFYNWMMQGDFPLETKQKLEKIYFKYKIARKI